jgi:hypothetical protein
MSAIGSIYAKEVKDNLSLWYAKFPIGESIVLGDFGLINDFLFERLGNITKKFGIKFDTRSGGDVSQLNFASHKGVAVAFHAKVNQPGGVPIRAGVDFDFTSEDALYFNCAGCTAESVEDQVALGDQILRLMNDGKWDKKFAVVTTLMHAESSTIVMSASSSASLKLQADSDAISSINMGDASLKLEVTMQRDLAIQIVTQGKLTPLLGLSGIHGSIFDDDTFGPDAGLLSKGRKQLKLPPLSFGNLITR